MLMLIQPAFDDLQLAVVDHDIKLSIEFYRAVLPVLAEIVPEHLLGLTGSAEEIAEVAAAFGIYHARAADPAAGDGGYQVDHTTTVTVLDRDGRARLLWAFGTEAGDMASDLRYLIDS